MAGIGPEWVHTRHARAGVNALAGEAALDFMFWPARRHKFGRYIEPAYDHGFVYAHDQSLGVTGGLLIAIPKAWERLRSCYDTLPTAFKYA